MKRILLMVFRNILLVPYMWIKLCHRAAHPENYTLEEHVKFLKWIVFRACRLSPKATIGLRDWLSYASALYVVTSKVCSPF